MTQNERTKKNLPNIVHPGGTIYGGKEDMPACNKVKTRRRRGSFAETI